MSVLFYISSGILALYLPLYLYIRSKRAGKLAFLAKTAGSFLLVLITISAIFSNVLRQESRLIMGGAALLCIAGNLIPELNLLRPKNSSIYVVSGFMISFLGHITYSIAMLIYSKADALWIFIAFAIAFELAFLFVFLAPKFNFEFKRLTVFCGLFIFGVLCTLCSALASAVVSGFVTTYSLMFVAGFVYLFGAMIQMRIHFGKKERDDEGFLPVPVKYMLIENSAYSIAQFLVGLSIFFF